MSNRILVTAIGSFSADCVINELKKAGNYVVGCDIYPSEWHAISKDCDKVYQAPLAVNEEQYIDFILRISIENGIKYIIPLTDVEIDVFNKSRDVFEVKGIILCIPSSYTLSIARDKYKLYQVFKDDDNVPSIKTYKTKIDNIPDIIPSIAKPYNGRSSEGLKRIYNLEELESIKKTENYIVQEFITGPVFTVDYVRSESYEHDFCIPREELLRTKNGAGTTVRVTIDENLSRLTSYIGNKLKVNGAINMEFIKNNNSYYLIDINPRFSAGVAFTNVSGYNMVISHLNCFCNLDIMPICKYKQQIIIKRYKEEIIN